MTEAANNWWLYLVGRCEFGPWFVSAAVVVLSMRDLYILMEAQDLSGL